MQSEKPVCLADFEAHFKFSLDRNARDYFSSGANQEQTLKDNILAFNRYRLRPRMLRDVSDINMKTTIMGDEIDFPIGVAPTAMQRMAHDEGELATARAATSMGTCMILSSWATRSIEEVAQASGNGLRWFQLYVYRDKTITANLVHRATQAGYKALVVTIDTPILGRRLADCRNGFNLPSHLKLANFSVEIKQSSMESPQSESGLYKYTQALMDHRLTWDTITWIKSITRLLVIVKGVLTAEDALLAVEHGVDGIMVSNHGARQLDGVLATIDALGEVVEAVNGRVEVYLDGGVRQGTDVLKALALGAKAVFIGRPILWGLSYQVNISALPQLSEKASIKSSKGQAGVEEVLRIIKEEFKLAMALSGCAKITDIRSSLLAHKKPLLSNL